MEPQHGSRSARACMVSVDRWVENDGLAYLVLSTLFITTTVCMTYALGYYEVSIATAGTWAGTEGAAARTLHMLQEGQPPFSSSDVGRAVKLQACWLSR